MTRKEKIALKTLAEKIANIESCCGFPGTLGKLPDGGYTHNAMVLKNRIRSVLKDIEDSEQNGHLTSDIRWDNY